MEQDSKEKVSKYISYLLRHNPENLKMDRHGFVGINDLLKKLRKRFLVDKEFILEIAERRDRKRFEIIDDKIRALYGHTIPVELELQEDGNVKMLYHGTTPEAANRILKAGLKPMKRKWVHLSPTREMAIEVGLRRNTNPVVLEINAEIARQNGWRFYKATEKVYVCRAIPSRYIKRATHAAN